MCCCSLFFVPPRLPGPPFHRHFVCVQQHCQRARCRTNRTNERVWESVNLGQVIFVLFSASECTQTRISILSIARTVIVWPSGQGSRQTHTKNYRREWKKIWKNKTKTFIGSCLWRWKSVLIKLAWFFVEKNRQHASIFSNNNHEIISLFKFIEKIPHSTIFVFSFYFFCFAWLLLGTIGRQLCFIECTGRSKCMPVGRKKDRNCHLECFQSKISIWSVVDACGSLERMQPQVDDEFPFLLPSQQSRSRRNITI